MNQTDRLKASRNVREANLWKVLANKFIPTEQVDPVFNTSELKGTQLETYLMKAYEELGGKMTFPIIRYNVALMEFGRFCVHLDDQAHFNRYRGKTLKSPFYEMLKSFPLAKYKSYCRNYETECLKSATSGFNWTNAEAELHFGLSQVSGDLGLSGSAGWKLTALKDLATDLIARKRKIRLMRLAIWDDMMVNHGLKKLNELLISPRATETDAIQKFVDKKVFGLYVDDM